MKAQIAEQVEFFSEAELESLEFVPEELEAIEAERVPDLDSISFEEVAKDLEAYFEGDIQEARLERLPHLPNELWTLILRFKSVDAIRAHIGHLINLRHQAMQANNMLHVVQLSQQIVALRNRLAQLLRH